MENQQITTWGGYGLAAAIMFLNLIPKGMNWIADQYTGNRTIRVRENEDFKTFLMAKLTTLEAKIESLQSKLDECEKKHGESEKRNAATEAKMELLIRQNETLIRQDLLSTGEPDNGE